MAKRGRPRKTETDLSAVDTSILTEEEKFAIRERAKKKVQAEAKERAEMAFEEQALAELRKQEGLDEDDEDLIQYTIDVAPSSQFVIVDGVRYQQGMTYTFTRRQYDTIREIIARSWAHESGAGDPFKKYYKAPNTIGAAQNAVEVYQAARSRTRSATGLEFKAQ